MTTAPLNVAPTPMNFIVPNGAGFVFVPPELPNTPRALWRASDLLAATYLTGDPIGVWGNASPPGLNLVQNGTGVVLPTFDNTGAFPCVKWSTDYSEDDWLECASIFAGNSERTIIAVWKNGEESLGGFNVVCGQEGDNNTGHTFNIMAAQPSDPYLAGYNHDVATSETASTSWQFAIADHDGVNTMTLRTSKSPTVYTNASGALATTATTFKLGYSSVQGFLFSGSIAEVAVYQRILTAPEIAQVKAYILYKFGIAQA
jgi:hypothetical protein